MERSTFVLAVFLMLFFSLSHGANVGIGRKMIGSFSRRVSHQETYDLDYIDAGPNFNGHGGIPVPSTPSPDVPHH